MKLVMVETTHHDCMKQMLYMEVRDPRVPSSYGKAILIPMWKTAICVELEKFKKHNSRGAVANLYGFPAAGQNFSIEFDKCVKEMGFINTPWDLKLFYKWINGKPLFVIAHTLKSKVISN